jgi:hypothetical protein
VGLEVANTHKYAKEFGINQGFSKMPFGFLELSMTVSRANIKSLFPPELQAQQQDAYDALEQKKTKVRFSFLGKTVESGWENCDRDGFVGKQGGDGYSTQGVICVPNLAIERLGETTQDNEFYDSAHCVFDIIEAYGSDGEKIIGTYECKLSTLVDFMRGPENRTTNGTKSPAVVPGTQSAHVNLFVPDRIQEKKEAGKAVPASIQVTFMSRKTESPNLTNADAMMPVSPSAVGVGLPSIMYTTQKGAYFDGRKGPGRFSVDHVGNCLEVFIKSFHFHDPHKEGTRYYAIIRCGSSSRTTPAYVRPRWVTPTKPGEAKKGEEKPWSRVHSDLDPKTVTMLHKIFLPLPADMEKRDIVEVELRSLYIQEPRAYTYGEAKQVQYAGGKIPIEDTYIGTAWLQIDRLTVGDERSLDNLRVSKDHPIQYEAFTCALIGTAPPEKPPLPFMNIQFKLTDKDLSKIDDRRDVILVGDGVVLNIEETVVLPIPENMPEFKKDQSLEQRKLLEKQCAIKYRKLFAPKLTQSMKDRKVLPLRPPCLRSELELSGMEGIQNFFFKQRGIPDYCNDPVPYQYIVARNEKDHERRGCQGSYLRVMNDMTDRLAADKTDKVVDSLSHLCRGVNCTVLAIYADRTASVEIQVKRMVDGEWKFINDDLQRWEEQRSKLLIPGSMEWRMEGGEPKALRLHGVHLSQLRSCECGGFSVYDAKLTGTITKEGNKSNLDATTIKEIMMAKTTEPTEGMIASGYGVTAGPLPMDANPYVCTYEWTFNVNLPTEAAMYDFVEALRGAARTSADQVRRQMYEAMMRPKVEQITGRLTDGSDKKGNVEIVLMEATRLREARPVSMLRHPAIQSIQRSIAESAQPLNPVVRMTIKSGDKKLFNPQEAPKIEAEINRARWCNIEQLRHLGGYTLRTPLLDLTKTDHQLAHIEFTVSNRLVDNVAVPVETTIATANLPVSDLMSCDTPFQQHILKLNGTERGELYLMTRYAVTRPEALRLDLATANEYLNHKIRIAQEVRSRFKCPPANFQQLYNANLSQQGPAFCRAARDSNSPTGHPEPQGSLLPQRDFAAPFNPATPPLSFEVEHEYKKTMFTVFDRDAGYAKAVLNRWVELEDLMKDKKDIGLLVAKDQNKEIGRLCEKLFKTGIPDEVRIDAWSDITNATKIGKDTTAMMYFNLVKSVDTGNNTASVMQLDEDFHALMAEGRSPFPDTQQVHENNLRRARDVCRALIAFSKKGGGSGGLHLSGFAGSMGVAYCRALLYIAYYLVLLCKAEEEHKVFFIMFAIIGHGSNRVFEDYHGLPKHMGVQQEGGAQMVPQGPALCSSSAAMNDVCFLDTALSIYEPALYQKLTSCGFYCSMFFYKAFMRLYASVLPELTLFRFWDRLFYETTAGGPPEGKSDPMAQMPPQRAVLIELAFGALTQSEDEGGMGLRENLMACSSSAEILDCLEVGFLIYDVDLVGELIEYGHARFGQSANPVTKTLMEATFAETMKIYTNFTRIFQAQTATISTLLTKPGAIGTERISLAHLDSVSIHRIVYPKVRDWFKIPDHYVMTKHNVLDSIGMLHRQDLPMIAPAAAPAAHPAGKAHAGGAAPHGGAASKFSHLPAMPDTRFAGFFRPYPTDVLEINQNLGIGTTTKKLFTGAVSNFFGFKSGAQILRPKLIDVSTEAKFESFGMMITEPTLLDYDGFIAFMGDVFPDFHRQHKKEVEDLFHYYRGVPASKSSAQATKESYSMTNNRTAAKDEKAFVSTIELLTSMAIVSSGSVCEKALLLFHIYAGKGDHDQNSPWFPHPSPPSVESTINRMDNVQSAVQIGKQPICMEPEGDVSALLFILRTKFDSKTKQRSTLSSRVFGFACIKELSAIRRERNVDPVYAQLAVWGERNASELPFSGKSDGQAHFQKRHQLVQIGYLRVEVKYIQLAAPTAAHDNMSTGRLEIAVKSFWFTRTPDGLSPQHIKYFNPKVECKTFTPSTKNDTVREVHLWKEKDIQCGIKDLKMIWPEPGGESGQQTTAVSGFKDNNVFVWDPKRVLKKSYYEMYFPEQLLKSVAGDELMISLQAVRLICISIFQRCMYPMTSRQAISFADSNFSRSRIAPCFTDAIVIKGPAPPGGYPSISTIYKGKVKKEDKPYKYTSVLQEVNRAWDKLLNQNNGAIDLWLWSDEAGKPSLDALIKTDPYGGEEALILRGRRAGDGDWFEYTLEFNKALLRVKYGGNSDADIDLTIRNPPAGTPLVPMDVQIDTKHLKWLNKREFMSGMIGAPILAESLRRMTSADTDPKESKEATLTVKVDTGVGDTEFSGFVQVGKKMLMEVWDSQTTGNKFLGEVYINDLEECREMYEGSFPLQAATKESIDRQFFKEYKYDERQRVFVPPATSDSRSKSTEWKTGMSGSKDKLKQEDVQGELSVSARWVFPEPLEKDHHFFKPDGSGEMKDRPEDPKEQEKWDDEVERTRNTGRLSLTIRKAKGLKATSSVLSSADTANAFVKIWVYNEEGKKWRFVHQTKPSPKTTEPVWSEGLEIKMYSGSYESRMDRFGVMAGKRDTSIEIKFGPNDPDRHGVKLFDNDTFFDLILKV